MTNPLVKEHPSRHISLMRFGLVTLLSLGVCASAIATPWDIVPVETSSQTAESKAAISSHTITMQRGGSSETLKTIDTLTLAPFAKNLGKISALTLAADGTIYAADRKTGRIWSLQDRGGDGAMDIKRPLPQTFQTPTALAIIDETLHVVDKRAVWAQELSNQDPPRLIASLANTQKLGDTPITTDGNALLLGVSKTDGSIVVRIDTATGQAIKIGNFEQRIQSLAKRDGAPLWAGYGTSLQSIDSPETKISFADQTIPALILPGQYTPPNDWPASLKDHIIAAQLGPKAMQLIAIPTEFGQVSGPPRTLVEGFLGSTGRSAWGAPGAMVMDKRGLFFADSYNGSIWRLSPAPKATPPKPEIKKLAEDTPKQTETPKKLPPSQRPLLKGSGIIGSQIGELSRLQSASQLETGSTIIEAYEKAKAEELALKEKEEKKSKR